MKVWIAMNQVEHSGKRFLNAEDDSRAALCMLLIHTSVFVTSMRVIQTYAFAMIFHMIKLIALQQTSPGLLQDIIMICTEGCLNM